MHPYCICQNYRKHAWLYTYPNQRQCRRNTSENRLPFVLLFQELSRSHLEIYLQNLHKIFDSFKRRIRFKYTQLNTDKHKLKQIRSFLSTILKKYRTKLTKFSLQYRSTKNVFFARILRSHFLVHVPWTDGRARVCHWSQNTSGQSNQRSGTSLGGGGGGGGGEESTPPPKIFKFKKLIFGQNSLITF